MEHRDDELIIQKRRELKKAMYNSLNTGMYVGNELVCFEDKLLGDGIYMTMPVEFQVMDDETVKLKYPMEQRPQIIWSNTDASVAFTISCINQTVQEMQLEQIRDHLCKTISSVYPQYIFTDKGKEEHGPGSCWWAEFSSPVVGGMLYNLCYTICLDGKLQVGMFNCPARYKREWKPIVIKMIRTIRQEVLV